MEVYVFHTLVIIFTAALIFVAIKILWDAITKTLEERRQERDAADAMIKSLSQDMRDQLKRVKGGHMRRHIIRWEKQQQRGMQ